MTKKELREINRREEDVLRAGIEWVGISLLGAAAVGILLMAGKASAETAEAQAAQVIQKNCTTRAETLYVPPVPAEAPTEGELPEAIDITPTEAAEPVEEWESLGTWKCTAYCPEKCCNGKHAWQTASGEPMIVGRTIAVGHLPFGTELMIDGHVYVVEDRGVRGNHVDILFGSHGEANDFGVQYKEVKIKR